MAMRRFSSSSTTMRWSLRVEARTPCTLSSRLIEIDHPQRNRGELAADRAEGAAEPHGVDAHAHRSSVAPVYSTAPSTPSPRVISRMARQSIGALVSTTRIGAPPRELAGLGGMAGGGDHAGAGELCRLHGGHAHAAGRAGDQHDVVHACAQAAGDDMMGGETGPHGGGRLVEVEGRCRS